MIIVIAFFFASHCATREPPGLSGPSTTVDSAVSAVESWDSASYLEGLPCQVAGSGYSMGYFRTHLVAAVESPPY